MNDIDARAVRRAGDRPFADRVDESRKCPFVAIVEMPSGKFAEFGADSADHAIAIALNWTRPEIGARAASCWQVLQNGSLSNVPFRICDPHNHLTGVPK